MPKPFWKQPKTKFVGVIFESSKGWHWCVYRYDRWLWDWRSQLVDGSLVHTEELAKKWMLSVVKENQDDHERSQQRQTFEFPLSDD